jgi:hypothetical protein
MVLKVMKNKLTQLVCTTVTLTGLQTLPGTHSTLQRKLNENIDELSLRRAEQLPDFITIVVFVCDVL